MCLDVAEDPIVVTDCEHIFCKKCVDIEGLIKCPSCQERFKEPRWTSLKGVLRRVYLDLKVKCLNPSCDYDMDISNFKEHDLVCPITFEFCKECGLKSRRGAENEHSCIQVIKDHYEGKLEQLEQKTEEKMAEKMAKMKEQLEKEMKQEIANNQKQLKEELTQNMGLNVEEVMKLKLKNELEQKLTEMQKQLEQKMEQKMEEKMAKLKEQLDGTEEKLKKERQRYEDFIALAVTGRNGFNDEKISDLNSSNVRYFRDPNVPWDTPSQIRDIKAILDKM